MNFKYFSKTLDRSKEVKRLEAKSSQDFMNKQFARLVDKHLTLPVTLYQL